MEKYIGILGGGQLALMLCESARKLGYKTIVLDPDSNGCSKKVADIYLDRSYTDTDSLRFMAEKTAVITYEFENVPKESIEILEKYGGNVLQGYRPLYISQNRIREKSSVRDLGVRVTDFEVVSSKSEIVEVGKILKTASGGYDGKGQQVISTLEDLENLEFDENVEYILEKKIELKKEVSIMVVRDKSKNIVSFPIGENIHKNGILYKSVVPANISKELELEIVRIGKKIIEGLDFYGPLGIEFFIDKNDNIYFNEMAPRPHNSIHYSLDACNYSQFDIIIKALVGDKIEDPKLLTKVIMINILGEDKDRLLRLNESKQKWKIKLYGKTPWKVGRKMGHINIVGDSLEDIEKEIKKYWEE